VGVLVVLAVTTAAVSILTQQGLNYSRLKFSTENRGQGSLVAESVLSAVVAADPPLLCRWWQLASGPPQIALNASHAGLSWLSSWEKPGQIRNITIGFSSSASVPSDCNAPNALAGASIRVSVSLEFSRGTSESWQSYQASKWRLGSGGGGLTECERDWPNLQAWAQTWNSENPYQPVTIACNQLPVEPPCPVPGQNILGQPWTESLADSSPYSDDSWAYTYECDLICTAFHNCKPNVSCGGGFSTIYSDAVTYSDGSIGYTLGGVIQNCVPPAQLCSAPEVSDGNGGCTCPSPYLSYMGACLSACPAGQERVPNGGTQCYDVCQYGRQNLSLACNPPPSPQCPTVDPTCPAGQQRKIVGQSNYCTSVCEGGTLWNSQSCSCVPEPTATCSRYANPAGLAWYSMMQPRRAVSMTGGGGDYAIFYGNYAGQNMCVRSFSGILQLQIPF